MNITEYRVRLCDSCFWITGYVEETFNGTVPVHCCCDRQRIRERGERVSPVMIGGVGLKGDVQFKWQPISGYIDERGKSCHVSYLSGMGGSPFGKPEHQAVFDAWAKDHIDSETGGQEVGKRNVPTIMDIMKASFPGDRKTILFASLP